MLREEAYKVVQAHAMKSWEEDGDFRAQISADPNITRHLSAEKLNDTFSVSRHLAQIDRIFDRVFQSA
jgi:adenylosuccinate lyase